MYIALFILQLVSGTFGNGVFSESTRDQSETILYKIDISNIKPIS